MARVGWLGLGAMGLPMARRLIEAAHDVAAYDPVPASLEALAAAGGRPASTAAAASDGGDLVVMVSGPGERFEACRPVLDQLGTTVAYVGEVIGDGQALKLVNQLLAG